MYACHPGLALPCHRRPVAEAMGLQAAKSPSETTLLLLSPLRGLCFLSARQFIGRAGATGQPHGAYSTANPLCVHACQGHLFVAIFPARSGCAKAASFAVEGVNVVKLKVQHARMFGKWAECRAGLLVAFSAS